MHVLERYTDCTVKQVLGNIVLHRGPSICFKIRFVFRWWWLQSFAARDMRVNGGRHRKIKM